MATSKKTKTVKKITEIPEATVRIEIEQTEEAAQDSEKEVDKTAKSAEGDTVTVESVTEDTPEEKEDTEESNDTVEKTEESVAEDEKEPEIENFDEENSRFSWSKVFLFIVIAAVTGLLIVGAFLFFVEDYNFTLTKEEPKKEISVEKEISPTPMADEVDKSTYEITVLNGSGIAGEAASVQALLEDDGFSVSEIGNAETADFTKTQILYLEDVNQDYLNALEKTLKTRGPIEAKKADSNQTEDIVIIVGSETSEK